MPSSTRGRTWIDPVVSMASRRFNFSGTKGNRALGDAEAKVQLGRVPYAILTL